MSKNPKNTDIQLGCKLEEGLLKKLRTAPAVDSFVEAIASANVENLNTYGLSIISNGKVLWSSDSEGAFNDSALNSVKETCLDGSLAKEMMRHGGYVHFSEDGCANRIYRGRVGYFIVSSKNSDDVLPTVLEIQSNRRIFAQAASRDPMTGLGNRSDAAAEFKYMLEEYGSHWAYMLLIDANGLKTINDVYEHERGDDYIKAIANTLKELRLGDSKLRIKVGDNEHTTARTGGDEFIAFGVLCDDTHSPQDARRFAAKVAKKVGNIFEEKSKELKKNIAKLAQEKSMGMPCMGLSIGAMAFRTNDNKASLKNLMGSVDKRMYFAKNNNPSNDANSSRIYIGNRFYSINDVDGNTKVDRFIALGSKEAPKFMPFRPESVRRKFGAGKLHLKR